MSLSGTTDNGLITLDGSAPNGTVESNLTFDGNTLSVFGGLVVSGGFTVSGSSTVINTTNLSVQDPIILLASTQSGTPTLDSGIFISRGSGQTQSLIWDESDDVFAFIKTNDSSSVIGNVAIDSYSDLRVANLSVEGFKLTATPSNGYFLQSDASGNGSWVQLSSIQGSGTASYLPKWSSATGLTNSLIYDNGSRVSIGTTSANTESVFHIRTSTQGRRNFYIQDTANNTSSAFNQSYGLYTDMSNSGTSSYAVYNQVTGSTVNNYGIFNYISSSTNSYGLYNSLSSTGTKYGLYNSSQATGVVYGVYNTFVSNSGTKYGSYTFLGEGGSPTNTTTAYGSYTLIHSGQNTYGQYIYTSPGLPNSNNRGQYIRMSTTASNWGQQIWIDGPGSGTGSYIQVSGTGSLNYGVYIDSYSASTNYGLVVNKGTSIFNESSLDNDFKIKGITNSNLFFVDASNDNIGIGTSTPNASAILHISSTTSGFLPPVMAGSQAEAIVGPTEGLLVYANAGDGALITQKGWWGYNGATWSKLNNF